MHSLIVRAEPTKVIEGLSFRFLVDRIVPQVKQALARHVCPLLADSDKWIRAECLISVSFARREGRENDVPVG